MNSFENIEYKKEREIAEFEDLRGLDLSSHNMRSSSVEKLTTVDFDTETKWPTPDKLPGDFDPEKLLENGKNPGLGIESLHARGIDGRGVVVAIIDQKLDIRHPEYRDAIKSYEEYGKTDKEEISMHGSAVTSLLVGRECGVAPGAELIYKAIPSGRNFLLESQALEDIIFNNKEVAANEKVRIVSCSIGYEVKHPEPGLNEWIDTLKKAKKEGIFVVDVGGDQIGVPFIGGGSSGNKNDFENYSDRLHHNEGIDKSLSESKKTIVVPSDYRTMASSWHKEGQYMYNGRGGISWSVPYLAGLFALALQVNPKIEQKEIAAIINESARINKNGSKIINPEGIVELAKERAKI